MNKKQKIIISITGITLVLLILGSLTYAYFLTRINGNTNTKSISATTADLALTYGDGNGTITTNGTIRPGEVVGTKTFTVTNTGDSETDYVVVLDEVSIKQNNTNTTFESNDFVYTLSCSVTTGTGTCDSITDETTLPIQSGNGNSATVIQNGMLIGNKIASGATQTYTLIVTYKETGIDQSEDMNKVIDARVNIKDIKTINPYSSNTSSLAYNIINNSMTGANGTVLRAAPLTRVAESTSRYSTGVYEDMGILEYMDSLGLDGTGFLYYVDDDTENSFEYNQCTSDMIGKSIIDEGPDMDSSKEIVGCSNSGEFLINAEKIESESTLSTTQDDLGTSYYYRGDVQDNYVNFAGKCWRIVRIEGDGSVKLILEDKSTTCESNTYTGNMYVDYTNYGYTQGKVTNSSGQQSQFDKYVADYLNGTTESENSMKYVLNNWYNTNLKDDYQSKLKNDTWCIGDTTKAYDYNTGALLNNSVNDLMYSNTNFWYPTGKRLKGVGETPNATLKCNGTTFDSYIGGITADEVVYAGGKVWEVNPYYYLINDFQRNDIDGFWTLSPAYFGGGRDHSFNVNDVGNLNGPIVDNNIGARPSVSLKSNTATISGGNGTKSAPYVIS